MTKPETEGNFNDPVYLAVSLAKKGYYGGDIDKLLSLPLSRFFDILLIENFYADYENQLHLLNIKK
jgi:hypothetical protein